MRIKSFVSGLLCGSILMLCYTGFAQEISKKVDVIFDSINIVVNGEKKNISNLSCDGDTYVKLRDLSSTFGKDVEWNADTSTVFIDEKDSLKMYKQIHFDDPNGFYPKFNYINLVFSEDMKPCTDLSRIKFETSTGEKAPLKAIQPGISQKSNLLFVLQDNLRVDTEYILSIPRNTLESIDGKKYLRDINLKFKTAHTVLLGEISSSVKIKTVTVINGDNIYPASLSSSLIPKFLVTNLEEGKNIIRLTDFDNRTFEKEIINVEKGMLNKVKIYPVFK